MDNSKWKKLLHPVRMEIIQTLAGGKELTASQLASLLPMFLMQPCTVTSNICMI